MRGSKKNKDNTLIQEFNKGNARAFREIFDLYYGPIFYFTRRLTGDEEAVDITSNTFEKLFKMHQNFESQENIRAFLYITSRNACFNYLKSRKTQKKQKSKFEYEANLSSEDSSAYEIKIEEEIKAAFLRRVYEAIDALPTQRRKVIRMVLQGLTPNDISKELKISINSVNNHKANALKDLRKRLGLRVLQLTYIFILLASK